MSFFVKVRMGVTRNFLGAHSLNESRLENCNILQCQTRSSRFKRLLDQHLLQFQRHSVAAAPLQGFSFGLLLPPRFISSPR